MRLLQNDFSVTDFAGGSRKAELLAGSLELTNINGLQTFYTMEGPDTTLVSLEQIRRCNLKRLQQEIYFSENPSVYLAVYLAVIRRYILHRSLQANYVIRCRIIRSGW